MYVSAEQLQKNFTIPFPYSCNQKNELNLYFVNALNCNLIPLQNYSRSTNDYNKKSRSWKEERYVDKKKKKDSPSQVKGELL